MKNAPTALNTISTDVSALSAAAQRARLLEYLQNNNALTTLRARHQLNIMHPAARVMELRQSSYEIVTLRRKDTDSAGRPHRVAEYMLMSGGKA